MRDQTIVVLAAVIGLVAVAVAPGTDPTLKAVAVGGIAGVVGGHLNGSSTSSNNSATNH